MTKSRRAAASLLLLLIFLLGQWAGASSRPPVPAATGPASWADSPVRPQDDFYRAVNHRWLSTAVIPPEKSATGGFGELADEIEARLMADFGAMLAGGEAADTPMLGQFLEFYRLAADYGSRNAAGAAPALPYLERIEALEELADLNAQLADWLLEGLPLPFSLAVAADMGDARRHALYAHMPGLYLPDKGYYRPGNEAGARLLAAYEDMLAGLLRLAGKTEAEAARIAAEAIAFDALLVPYARSSEERSDIASGYNPWYFQAMAAAAGQLDFTALAQRLWGAAPEQVILGDPAFFAAFNRVVNDETFHLLKSWMLAGTLLGLSDLLSEEFYEAAGAYSMALSGAAAVAPPEKRAYRLAAAAFSPVVGDYYGRAYLGEAAREDVLAMATLLVAEYKAMLQGSDWLTGETKARAIRKLDGMSVHIGYPDSIDPLYERVAITPAGQGGTLVGNSAALSRLLLAEHYAKLHQPVEHTRWAIPAATVNAVYSPLSNTITFPAAILQAPFYSPEQSPSRNYSAIGAVIAHEISHAFDSNGARFDENGTLRNWWTPEDSARFSAKTAAMAAAFDGLEHGGGTVNGALTVTENTADAGGLRCALNVVKTLPGHSLEEFFTGWATIWRGKRTPEYEQLLLAVDVHAPGKLRANLQLSMLDEFHETFGVTPGDAMYLPPDQRVAVW